MVLDGRVFSVDALLGRTHLDHYSLIPDPVAAGFSFALPQAFSSFINLGCYQIVTRCLCYL
ncbi:acnA regulatory region 60-length spurious protein [Escherichia coli]|nr:acnA regulatory region 60-length spurious protein [Escherichia coli]EGD7494676.1 acnA regulatory region 60-length spurious protein [Shigella dysenteriae]EEW6055427.1 acnA regulatory region 60-length spurious protein [Escherichia coli]EEW8730866.1 acnA regulatory region 60-length spurious protein [Escherichia coli]EFO3282579.1 acnA regulatory region 60-length spurious protein [Escherichia coli]